MRATVLVADDDENVRVPVAECLQSEGFRVLTAANGAAVVQQLAKTAVDLLILDLHMPVLDGVGVLAAIKGKPHSRDIPVLIMSGRPQDAPPGVAVLGKACGLEQLISTVEHLLSAARPLKATAASCAQAR